MADADRKAYQKAWREANAEKLKAYQQAYREANREKLKAQQAEYYRANADDYKNRAAEWAAANKARRYEITSKWRSEHPELYAEARKRDWLQNNERRKASGKAFREQNPELMKRLWRDWQERFPGANAHHVGMRRTRQLQAMPAWADVEAIKAIYAEAKRITAETGVEQHVDHFYPLAGKTVCGLHNEFNLRVIPASANLSKRNKLIDS